MKKDAPGLADIAKSYLPLPKERFYTLRNEYEDIKCKKEQAAVYFVLNRSSFSGLTFSGGMSPEHLRFTGSAIEDLRKFKAPNLHVELLDCYEALEKHRGKFIYLDPPYANDEKLYGVKGSTHVNFDHVKLAEVLKTHEHWLLSYNDCELVRDLYKGYNIQKVFWSYGGLVKNKYEILVYSKKKFEKLLTF